LAFPKEPALMGSCPFGFRPFRRINIVVFCCWLAICSDWSHGSRRDGTGTVVELVIAISARCRVYSRWHHRLLLIVRMPAISCCTALSRLLIEKLQKKSEYFPLPFSRPFIPRLFFTSLNSSSSSSSSSSKICKF